MLLPGQPAKKVAGAVLKGMVGGGLYLILIIFLTIGVVGRVGEIYLFPL